MGNQFATMLPHLVLALPHIVELVALVKTMFKPGVAPAPKPGVSEEAKEQV